MRRPVTRRKRTPLVDVDFHDAAACRGEELGLFFGPPEADDEAPAERELRVMFAKDVCERCPVRSACAEDALTRGDTHGIRGGLTPTELVRERRRRQRQRSAA